MTDAKADRTNVNDATGEVESAPKFTEWLADHRNGVLDVDVAEAFADVVEAVIRTTKPGSVTLTLKVSTQGDMIAVVDEIKAKIPELAEPRLYWRGLDGRLSRDNPLQPRMLTDDQ